MFVSYLQAAQVVAIYRWSLLQATTSWLFGWSLTRVRLISYCLSGNLLAATNKHFYTDFAKKKHWVGLESDLTCRPFSPIPKEFLISLWYVFGQPHSQGFSFYGKGLGNEVDRFPANQGRRCVKRKWVKFLVEFLVKFLVKLKFSFPIKSPCKQR